MTEYVKYPRTYHLPWSPGITNDDKIQTDLSYLKDQTVVVSVKMDGESCSMYQDHIHARSLTSGAHPSRTWVKNLHASIAQDIPKGIRICGENLFAKHSIHYKNLESYFYVHSIWDQNICLPYYDTRDWANLLGLSIPKVLYQGEFDEELLKQLYQPIVDGDECEGYVVRPYLDFGFRDFKYCVLKYVRANHVQTNEHWLNSYMVKNELRAAQAP